MDPNFAAMVFYGAIEQLLTGWIFGLLPATHDYPMLRPVGDAVAG